VAHARVRYISAANSLYSLVITDTGELYGWGDVPERRQPLLLPRKFKVPKRLEVAIACCTGMQHGLAIGEGGALFSFGSNFHGQLGVGESVQSMYQFAAVKLPPRVAARAACAGEDSSFVLSTCGDLYSFGCNRYEQLGHPLQQGAAARIMLPTRVTAAYGQCVAEIAAGGEHTAVRLCNGQLFSFGTNRQGQLGHRPLDQAEGEPSQIKLSLLTGLISRPELNGKLVETDQRTNRAKDFTDHKGETHVCVRVLSSGSFPRKWELELIRVTTRKLKYLPPATSPYPPVPPPPR